MKQENNSYRGIALGLAAVTEAFTISLGSVAAGYGLDYWLKTKPWFTVALTVIGFCVGFYELYRRVIVEQDEGKGPGPRN